MSRESEIPHDKRFSYQANPRLDMILKNNFYNFYLLILFKKRIKNL